MSYIDEFIKNINNKSISISKFLSPDEQALLNKIKKTIAQHYVMRWSFTLIKFSVNRTVYDFTLRSRLLSTHG